MYVLPRPLVSHDSINRFADHYRHCVNDGLTVAVERLQLRWEETSDGCLAAVTTHDPVLLFTLVGDICVAMDITTGRSKRSTPAKKKQKTSKPEAACMCSRLTVFNRACLMMRVNNFVFVCLYYFEGPNLIACRAIRANVSQRLRRAKFHGVAHTKGSCSATEHGTKVSDSTASLAAGVQSHIGTVVVC